jgi:hypothetical protein
MDTAAARFSGFLEKELVRRVNRPVPLLIVRSCRCTPDLAMCAGGGAVVNERG